MEQPFDWFDDEELDETEKFELIYLLIWAYFGKNFWPVSQWRRWRTYNLSLHSKGNKDWSWQENITFTWTLWSKIRAIFTTTYQLIQDKITEIAGDSHNFRRNAKNNKFLPFFIFFMMEILANIYNNCNNDKDGKNLRFFTIRRKFRGKLTTYPYWWQIISAWRNWGTDKSHPFR